MSQSLPAYQRARDPLDMEAEYLQRAIRALQEAYERQAKPLVDRLADIEAMRPPPPMIIQMDGAAVPKWIRDQLEASGP